MPSPRPRKPRFQRVSPPPAIRLTGRDFLILDHVSRHRFLRSDHLTDLVPGSQQHITRRLGRLYHAGLLERPRSQLRLPGSSGALVYCLSERGRKELIARQAPVFSAPPRIRKAATSLRLAHDLRVSDVLVCLQRACLLGAWFFFHHHDWETLLNGAQPDALRPLKWSIRTRLKDRRHLVTVIPDAAFALHDGKEGSAYFLLEVDRGTMPVTRSDPTQTSFVRKVQAYRETRKAGVLWKHWEVPGFRVLVVTESRKRMHSLQQATSKCFRRGRSTMFLFAVAEDLLAAADPLTAPWQNCMGEPAVLVSKPATQPALGQSLLSEVA